MEFPLMKQTQDYLYEVNNKLIMDFFSLICFPCEMLRLFPNVHVDILACVEYILCKLEKQ